jgi:pimeloyl-ACP methyl ester carboxylesterase
MRRVLVAVLVVIVAALAVNTILTDRNTTSASADLGRTLDLPGGHIQERGDGPYAHDAIVLLHGFASSMHWWTPVAARLARRKFYVVRFDLLGHGGSEKTRHGYSMENQARLIQDGLRQLRVEHAVVVGHSMGGRVATALAERDAGVVDGLVLVDSPVDEDASELPFVARLGFVPVIGEALRHLVPDSLVRNQLESAFAPGFEVPDQFVRDFHRMTYSSYDHSHEKSNDYLRERALDARLRSLGEPLLAIYGSEDDIVDPDSFARYSKVPGATVKKIAGAGHSPMVEKPAQVSALIAAFARRVAGSGAASR